MTTHDEKTETRAEQRTHVHEILSKTTEVMLLTYTQKVPDPVLRARPLHVTKVDDDGALWFMVGLDSRKVHELREFDDALVTAQQGARWIHLTGKAHIVTDRTKIRQLWSKMHEVWFPLGADDPNVCLLHYRPSRAEYWDNSGVVGIRYLFEMAKALVTGQAAGDIKGVHGATDGRVSTAPR